MPEIKRKTKECPFCAETILAAAVKCRFCSEFLYPEDHPALENLYDTDEPEEDEEQEDEYEEDYEEDQDDDILFRVRPSMFASTALFVKTAIFIALAVALFEISIEDHIQNFAEGRFTFTDSQKTDVYNYRILGSVVIGMLAVLIFIFKILVLKSTAYEISPDRIEWERGLFNRKIDNVDMFRVIDLKLHRSLTDCFIGIGTVTLITKDDSDPEFNLYKIRNPREVFNALKKASLQADKNQGVIHVD